MLDWPLGSVCGLFAHSNWRAAALLLEVFHARWAENGSRIESGDEQGETDSRFWLGHSVVRVVSQTVPSRPDPSIPEVVASAMALMTAVLTLVELAGFCMGFAALGNAVLRCLRLEMDRDPEHLLSAVAVGIVTSEILVFLVEITQRLRIGCFGIAALLCGLVILEWKRVWKRLKQALGEIVPQSPLAGFLLTLIAIVVLVEFLSAMAPLTGSDALVYHFAVQKQTLSDGFHAIFSNSHSFVCGQQHLLILFGLALGGEQLAMGFIFLGGMLAAASLACLASRWASGRVVAGFVLLFLVTPLVFWQVMSSGSPDIYMAFFAAMAVNVLCAEGFPQRWQQGFLVGLLAGGVAGAKYTGCFVAAAIALAVVMEMRSIASVSLFLGGSLVSGIWPYLRNLVWTGDPVFPFLAGRLSSALSTPYTLAELYADTGTSASHHVMQVLPFVLFAGARSTSGPALWEFFGPTVLILAPLMFLALDNERRWRVPIVVWVASSLGIALSSGMARFLLPVFPLALACSAGGFEVSRREGWTWVRRIIGGLMALVGLGCAAGLAIYSQAELRVAIGQEEKTEYLKERGPEYQIAQAVNRVLGGSGSEQRTLVFMRHTYYLDVPYVNGDPGLSFEVDPTKLQSTGDWKAFFDKKRIGYVVRSPSYPRVIASPLEKMESEGDLIPIARSEVQDFQGVRVNQARATIPVVILRVSR